jgi:signal transduction histidine kinase
MHAWGNRESGRTLGRTWGFPYLWTGARPYKVRRVALAFATVVALAAALAAAAAALNGVADAGIQGDLSGGTIEAVSPTGFAWRDGIRPDQIIVKVDKADSADGWRLTTRGPDGLLISRSAPIEEALRASLPLGIGGVVLAALAILFLRTHRGWVLPAASVALQLASVPLWIHGNRDLSTWSMALAAFVPGAWIVSQLPVATTVRVLLGLGGIGALAYWAGGRLGGVADFEMVDAARALIATGGAAAIVIDHGLVEHPPGVRGRGSRITAAYVAVVALLAGAGLVSTYFFAVTPLLAVVAVAIGVLALPRVRKLVGRRVQDVLLADIREQAKAQAVEGERARLARELHDVPLQQLVAVLRSLELVPGAEAEVAHLQQVVDEIREVAIDLRPPVLDDLGLAAGLDFLAEETATPTVPVLVNLDDTTGFEAERRPPEDVELAIYRIAQEAVLNAVRHARPTSVLITGSINPDGVDVRITDDGTGLTLVRLKAASSKGRMGLASMRRRAQAIGAELSIDGREGGTVIRVQWMR